MRSKRRHSLNTPAYCSPRRCSKRVDPSISVKSSVTVPVGSCCKESSSSNVSGTAHHSYLFIYLSRPYCLSHPLKTAPYDVYITSILTNRSLNLYQHLYQSMEEKVQFTHSPGQEARQGEFDGSSPFSLLKYGLNCFER